QRECRGTGARRRGLGRSRLPHRSPGTGAAAVADPQATRGPGLLLAGPDRCADRADHPGGAGTAPAGRPRRGPGPLATAPANCHGMVTKLSCTAAMQKRILIGDDEPAIRDMVAFALRQGDY